LTTINKKDFIEIEYTGRLQDNNILFDTTDKALAEKENLHNPKMEYGPITICVGEHHILKGIDDFIIGKEIGKEYALALDPENAFGKKNPKLLKIIPASIFKKQKINPMPGLSVNIDGVYGIIKTVTGGRTIVDFNHPLAGRGIIYTLKVKRIVSDTKEKAHSLLKMLFNVNNIELKVENDNLEIEVNKIPPKELEEELNKKIKELIPEIKNISYKERKKEENKETSKE